jgi:hypothetical protein
VTVDDVSDVLFGRYQSLRVYATIARLVKDEFTTGQLADLTGVPGSQLSKELGRLARLELIRPTSRRGDYTRNPDSAFWGWIDAMAAEWGFQ